MGTNRNVKLVKNVQYYKFCLYGFFKNQRFFEPFLILIFLHEKGLSYTQIGVLYSVRFILRALFEIPSGIIADAFGRRGVMLFSYSAYMISFIAYYYSNSFLMLIVPSSLFALGDAFRTGTHKAMMFEYLKYNGWEDHKVSYYGHTRSWSQAGSAISSLLAATFVILGGNYNTIFIYSLIPYTIGFILLASYPPYLEGSARNNMKLRNRKKLSHILKNTITTFRQYKIFILGVNISAYSGFYMSAKDYLQVILSTAVISIPLLNRMEVTTSNKEAILIGAVYFILYFVNSIASRQSGFVRQLFKSDYTHINTLLIIGLLMSICAGMFLNFNFHILSAVFFMGILVIENLRRPAGVALLASKVDSEILASALSIESQLNSMVAAAISLLIGIFADILNPGYALAIASTIILLLYPLINIKNIRESND